MIVHTNHTITAKRLVQTGEMKDFSQILTGLDVYINQVQEEILEGYENQPSFISYRMMTDGDHEAIEIGDRIIDENGKQYDVRAKAVSEDLTGVHHQYLIIEYYE